MTSGKVTPPGSQTDFSSSSKRSGAGSSTDIRGKAAEAGSKLAGVAHQTLEDAKRATSSLASDANERVKGLLDQQVAAGADVISNVADSIRVAADNLEPRIPQLANVARDASQRIEDFSQDIRQQSASELAEAVAQFARRRPAVVFGMAAALGFVAFRLLNAGVTRQLQSSAGGARSSTDWRPDTRLGGSAYPVASSTSSGPGSYPSGPSMPPHTSGPHTPMPGSTTQTNTPGSSTHPQGSSTYSQTGGGYPAGPSTHSQGSTGQPSGTTGKSTENSPPITPSSGRFHGT